MPFKPYILFFLFALVFFPVQGAYGKKTPDDLTPYMTGVEKVGQADLRVMFWDVYTATLWAPRGVYNKKKPFALQLDYLRTLKGKDIARVSIEEIRKQGVTDELKLAAWHNQLWRIFPDVKKGDRLTGIRDKNGNTVFIQNGKVIGTVKGIDFTGYFFDIWLGAATSHPGLRAQLLKDNP